MTTAERAELERQLRDAELLLNAIERDSGTRDEIRDAIYAYFRARPEQLPK